MFEGGEHLRFTAEARHTIAIVNETLGQDFQGDIATELRIRVTPLPFHRLMTDISLFLGELASALA
jgi:hypothetical protein